MLCIGLLIRYLISWRRFRRRNVAGLQLFPSYLVAVIIQLLERLCSLIGFILIVLGALTIFIRL